MAYIHPPYFITAYEIAVKYGFTGTEEEWLDSLGGLRKRHSVDISDDSNYNCHVDFYDADATEITKNNLDRLGLISAVGKIKISGTDYDIKTIEKISSGVKVTYFTTGVMTGTKTVVTTGTVVTDIVTNV